MVVSLGGFAVFGYGALGTLRAARRRNRPKKDIVVLEDMEEPTEEDAEGTSDRSREALLKSAGEISVAPAERSGPEDGALA
jgi:hypothetical protein